MPGNVVTQRRKMTKQAQVETFENKVEKISSRKAPEQVRKIALLDLTRKYKEIAEDLHRQWDIVFSSMRLLNGANLAAFEQEFAAYCSVKHAVGVASGTDAIYLSLLALKISQGDEVILPAHAPAPVLEPVLAVGLRS
jgi:dTDP-4-amino-4,6-dideoxygalactose transaminase